MLFYWHFTDAIGRLQFSIRSKSVETAFKAASREKWLKDRMRVVVCGDIWQGDEHGPFSFKVQHPAYLCAKDGRWTLDGKKPVFLKGPHSKS